MRLKFLFSKNKEKEKLLNIYDEYQWFINNDFPLELPEFYNEIYKSSERNKKLFLRKLDTELKRIYFRDSYQVKRVTVKHNWGKIEKEFFTILKKLNLDVKDKYFCNLSLYGPEGQFKYPDIINLRVGKSKDIKNANETIAHEIIH